MQLAERLDPGPPFAWSGEFCRLDLPGQTLRGVLAIDEGDGVTLRLFGTFSDTHPFGSLLNAQRPEWTLQGNIEDGEAVTIIGARHVGGREQHPGAVELHLKADAALIGDRLVDLTTRFDQVAVAYDELAIWTSGPGTPIAGWSNVEPEEQSPRRLGRLAFWGRTPRATASSMRPISYQDRAEARADVPGLGSVSLIARGVVRPIPAGANLTEEAEFKVVTSQPLMLQEVDDDVRVPLDRLLALAFDRKVTRRHLRVRIEGDEPPPFGPRRPLEVIVPRGTNDAEVDDFLEEKRLWVERKVAAAREIAARPPRLRLDRRGSVWLAGEELPIERRDGRRSIAALSDGRLVVSGPSEGTPGAVERWYRREARRRIDEVVALEVDRLGFEYRSIGIRDPRTRWGSCSRKGNLSFSWRLAAAPPEILKYVVVHELCHLREPSHQKPFWRLLAVALPGWQEQARWLREHGQELHDYDPARALSTG